MNFLNDADRKIMFESIRKIKLVNIGIPILVTRKNNSTDQQEKHDIELLIKDMRDLRIRMHDVTSNLRKKICHKKEIMKLNHKTL